MNWVCLTALLSMTRVLITYVLSHICFTYVRATLTIHASLGICAVQRGCIDSLVLPSNKNSLGCDLEAPLVSYAALPPTPPLATRVSIPQ
jgi:hypothetical protein